MSLQWKFELQIEYCLVCGIHRTHIDLGTHQEVLSTKNHHSGRHKLTGNVISVAIKHDFIYAFKTQHKVAIINMNNMMIITRITNKAATRKIQMRKRIHLVWELYKWCCLATDVQSNLLYCTFCFDIQILAVLVMRVAVRFLIRILSRPQTNSLPLIKLCNSG